MTITGPFKQVITMDLMPDKGHLIDNQLAIITDGGILHLEGKILETGKFDDLIKRYNHADIEHVHGEYVCLPGLIDAHTHICWAGSRAKDYAMRLAGKTYQEIAQAGGGIWDTVVKTRETSISDLAEITLNHADFLLSQGITTIEVKSSYGLSVEQELKMLEAIEMANFKSKADLVSTCLAAHIVPKDFEGSENEYLELIIRQLLPEIKRNNLSNRVDIFVEKGAFSILAAKKYLLKAKEMGLDIVLHGDQFSLGGAALAAEVQALSIDHLEAANEEEIAILANSNVIPVVLPGASLGLGEAFAPARKLLDAGTSLVIASDWNPGSAPMGNLLVQAAILGAAEKLTMAEVWSALTYRAAKALNINNKGILKPNYTADFIAFKTDDYKEILYNQGQMKPEKIWKNGILIKN